MNRTSYPDSEAPEPVTSDSFPDAPESVVSLQASALLEAGTSERQFQVVVYDKNFLGPDPEKRRCLADAGS